MRLVRIILSGFILFSIPSFAQVTFHNVPINSLPSTPQASVKGDFNNDGLIDVAVCNFNSFANQQVTLLLNTGSGTFTGTNKRNFASSTNPSDIAVGDFNKDGNLDVVTCSQSNGDFSLLLGAGNGNLAAPVNFPVGPTPRAIAVGDFNNDSNPDVIVSNSTAPRQVFIFLGNGNGGFSTPTTIDFAILFGVAVGDFNGDSNLDFAVTADVVQPWFGNGSGTSFTPGTAVTGFSTALDIIAHDLDGDGDLDLSTGNAYTLNNGSGVFAAPIAFSQTGAYMTPGDLNGDGQMDIIARDNTQNYQNVRVFAGNGTGTFTLLAKFETNVNPRSIELVDVNNDGKLDAVGVGTNGTTHSADVLLGDGTGYFSNAIAKFPTAPDPRDMVLDDFNLDGITDVAISHTAGNFFAVYLGTGNGRFTKTATNYTTGTNPFRIQNIDFNKDGIPDLLSVNSNSTPSITPFTGQGDGSFTPQANIGFTGNNVRITIGDFNKDTNQDIIATGGNVASLYFIAGTGTGFSPAVTIPISENALEVRTSDFNNDSNLDLAVAYSSPNRVVVFFGNGNGTFTEGSQYPMNSGFFEVQDLNNDGRPDINAYNVTIGTDDDFYINDGTGVFTGTNYTAGFTGTVKDFADMNGDGFKDLILSSQFTISSEPGIVRIFSGSASGPTTTQLINKQMSGGHKVLARDFNSDGKNDLISVSFNIYEDYFAVLINNTVAVGCPVITTQPISQTSCEGQSITLSVAATGNAPLSYQWRKDLINIPSATTATLSFSAIDLLDAGSYTCVVSNLCGSTTSSAAVVSINSTPEPPFTTNADRCGPGSVVLTATNGSDGNFRWYTQAIGGTAIAGAVNSTYSTPLLTATTTYYVAVANAFCESERTPVTATITPGPIAPAASAEPRCGPGTVTLTASGGTNGQYRWYDVASGGTALAGEVNSILATPPLSTSTNYYVSINDNGCESARTEVIASIFSIPTKPIITASETINAGIVAICLQPITLSAPAGFSTYAWSNGETTQQIITQLSGNYSVEVTDANGCSSPMSDIIQVINNTTCVNSPPNIITTTVQTFIGGKVTIDLTLLISDQDGNLDPTSLEVVGNATQKGGKTTVNGFILEIDYATAKFSGQDFLIIRVCDLLNECFETNLEIEVIGDIVVYNGISPNGDLKNDKWVIEYITLFPDTENNHVTIYNRWGSIVWEASFYNNDDVVFTGLNKNGNELSTGTYFYKIEFINSEREMITGYLSLKR